MIPYNTAHSHLLSDQCFKKCVTQGQSLLYYVHKDLLPFTHTKSQYFWDILAQQDALQHKGGQGVGDSDYKGDEVENLMEYDEEHLSIMRIICSVSMSCRKSSPYLYNRTASPEIGTNEHT
ncbi:hypothetical protein E2C01_024696 [Portunus trituberculatus]|uniref:Uncharacterized protein n=1 Tax=Portunus trituberculatus TaxID=210409 RepID=A0A5B7ED22_PORTR|nr:hypothetical protein [Portunus trituberculatus]